MNKNLTFPVPLAATDVNAWPPRNPNVKYDWKKQSVEAYSQRSIEESSKETKSEKFTPTFSSARSRLDYNYHTLLVRQRQILQDAILERIAADANPVQADAPWIVFSAGPMGVGKGYVLTQLQKLNILDLKQFVKIDPDLIKTELPEMAGYLQFETNSAATKLHRESTQMADILLEDALMKGLSILVDGSLRDVQYYSSFFKRLKEGPVKYRIAILHVTADDHVIRDRAASRAVKSGRVVPPDVLQESIDQVPRSVKALTHLADAVHTIANNEGKPLELVESIVRKDDGTMGTNKLSWCEFRESFSSERIRREGNDEDYHHVVSMAAVYNCQEANCHARKIWQEAYPSFCSRCALSMDGQCGVCSHGKHICACSECHELFGLALMPA